MYGGHVLHIGWQPGTRILPDASNTVAVAKFEIDEMLDEDEIEKERVEDRRTRSSQALCILWVSRDPLPFLGSSHSHK